MLLKNNQKKSYWFIFDNNKIVVSKKMEILLLSEEETSKMGLSNILHFGQIDSISCYSACIDNFHNISRVLDDYEICDIKQLYVQVSEEFYAAAVKAKHLMHWNNNNVFCGRCGSKMDRKEDELAKKCNNCGNVVYPRISPAIIVAITKGNEILLAHSKHFAKGLYTVIAGFVEAGESLEQCVKREIKEEINIEVKNIKYFGSQPWPFPDSLMFGFTAEYESGEVIVDGVEIEDAQWFSFDSLPMIPEKFTIARKLIDNYVERIKNN